MADFECLGTHPGGSGTHFEPKARIFCDFDDISERTGDTFLRSFLDTFCINFFGVFLSARFSGFFVILGAQRLHNGRHLEVILPTFSRPAIS